MNDRKEKQGVLITGASAGIGRALAACFAAGGHDLILVARREQVLQQLAAELNERHGVKVVPIAMDLASPQAPQQLQQIVQQHGLEVDVLVNNAGVLEAGAFRLSDPEAVQRMLRLNVLALTGLTHAFLAGMVERGYGRVLNVASVAAFQPVVGLAAYAATKAYVLSLSEALGEELRGSGVTVTALCPGLTDTDMAQQTQALHPDLPAIPPLLLSSVEQVAAEGYAACMAGEALRVPGWANRMGTLWSQLQPRWVLRRLGGLFGRQLLQRR